MRPTDRKGFTLIEILIGVSLSVVIFLILFSALRLGYKSQERGTEKEEITQTSRILSDRISWMIRGVYAFSYGRADKAEPPNLYFQGDSDSLGFVTTSVDVRGKGPEDLPGLKWISLFTDREGLKVREKVFFLEDVFDDSGGKVYLLDPDVTEIEFKYYDVPEGEKSGEWVSEWDHEDKKYFPSAVKFKITLERNKKKIELPETIVWIHTQKYLEPKNLGEQAPAGAPVAPGAPTVPVGPAVPPTPPPAQ